MEHSKINCCQCDYYGGVKGTPGHAPCKFWNIGGVMWNDGCKRWKGEPRMDNNSYYMDQLLKRYKEAITDAFKQFQLDDESRIAAAHAVIDSCIEEYRHTSDIQRQDYQRAVICGVLSMAAACHLLSFDEISKYKETADIDRI